MARVEWEKDGKSGPRGRLRLSQVVLTSTDTCGFHIKCN